MGHRPRAARWSAEERGRWRFTLRWLAERFPLPCRVHVRRVAYVGQYGAAYLEGKLGRILIASRLGLNDARHTLFEEWAHLRDMTATKTDHGPTWAIEYGAIRDAYEADYHPEG